MDMHFFERKLKPAPDNYYYGGFGTDPLSPLSVSVATFPEGPIEELLHYHTETDKVFLTLSGEGVIEIDGKEVRMHAEELIHVEPGEVHAVKYVTKGPMQYVVVRSKNIDDKITLDSS